MKLTPATFKAAAIAACGVYLAICSFQQCPQVTEYGIIHMDRQRHSLHLPLRAFPVAAATCCSHAVLEVHATYNNKVKQFKLEEHNAGTLSLYSHGKSADLFCRELIGEFDGLPRGGDDIALRLRTVHTNHASISCQIDFKSGSALPRWLLLVCLLLATETIVYLSCLVRYFWGLLVLTLALLIFAFDNGMISGVAILKTLVSFAAWYLLPLRKWNYAFLRNKVNLIIWAVLCITFILPWTDDFNNTWTSSCLVKLRIWAVYFHIIAICWEFYHTSSKTGQCCANCDDAISYTLLCCNAHIPHRLCRDCFEGQVNFFVKNVFDDPEHAQWELKCFVPGGCEGVLSTALVAHLGREKLEHFIKAVERIGRYRGEREAFAAAAAERRTNGYLRDLEDVLTLKCPHCQTAFLDFEGCGAVTCSFCQGHFCAWCIGPCNDSRLCHQHVSEGCNIRRRIEGHQHVYDMFARKDAYDQAHRLVKLIRLRQKTNQLRALVPNADDYKQLVNYSKKLSRLV